MVALIVVLILLVFGILASAVVRTMGRREAMRHHPTNGRTSA